MQEVLCPMATTVKVELYAHCSFFVRYKLSCGHTGIGDAMVWYGFPDALVNCSLTVCCWDDKIDEELEYHLEFKHASDSNDIDNENSMVPSVTTIKAKKMTNPFLC